MPAASVPSSIRSPSGACAGGIRTNSALAPPTASPSPAPPAPNRTSACPSSTISTSVRGSAHAAFSHVVSWRRCATRSSWPRASASCPSLMAPSPSLTKPPPHPRTRRVRPRCLLSDPRSSRRPGPSRRAARSGSQASLADGSELHPKVGGGLGALQQERHLDLLVRGMDAIAVQPNRHEHQRRPENAREVGLGPAATLAGEQHLLPECPLHGGACGPH